MKKRNSETGHSLIELAIVTLVAGVLISSFLAGYNVYIRKTTTDTTVSNTGLVTRAVGNFLIQQGRYPCPARADLDRNSPDYGMEGDCADVSQAAGTCANGICIETGARLLGATPAMEVLGPGPQMASDHPEMLLDSWLCGAAPCNYAEYLGFIYTNDPSMKCPNSGDEFEATCPLSHDHDLCDVGEMRFYQIHSGFLGIFAEVSVPAFAGTAPRVRRGTVPFRTLNLPEEFSEDGYGMKIDYAVTEPLAVSGTYDKNSGGVAVVDGNGNTLVEPAGSAHFVMVSHGPDKQGATTRQGKMGVPCPAGNLDTENCNTSAASAVYRAAAKASVSGAAHFDDNVEYYTAVDTPLWRVATDSSNIRDLVNAGSPGGGTVGVGAAIQTQTVEVAGDIRGRDSLLVTELCDKAGTSCFPTDKITGDKAEMKCPAGEYVSGIANGQVICTTVPEFRCPPGALLTGVSTATGSLNCVVPVPCPARTVTVCTANDRMLAAGVQGQTQSVTAGDSRVATYKCNAGAWSLFSATGVCSCTAADTTTYPLCTSVLAGGWTGNATVHTVTTCLPYASNTTTDISACVCTPISQTTAGTCSASWTGGKMLQRDWTCGTPTSGSWGAWYVISDTCVCNALTQTQNLSCPTAYTGIWTQSRTFTCPSTWSAWADVVNTCVCTGLPAEMRTVSCGAGFAGNKVQKRTYTCGTGWSAWVDFPDPPTTCSPVTFTWKAQSTPVLSSSQGAGSLIGSGCPSQYATASCWGYAPGSKFNNYPTCSCE
ncbi:MAG: hypothetical protein V1721_03805 [Pseudomonadota bacterium]